MATRTVSYQLLIDWDRSGTFSFNESNYLFSANGNESTSNPNDTTFSNTTFTSECTLLLLNTSARFTTTNVSSPLYSYISTGKFYQCGVRLNVIINGTTYRIFTGFIKSIKEMFRNVESGGKVTVVCRSNDDQLKFSYISTGVQTTYNFYVEARDEGEIIASILGFSGLVDGVHYRSQSQVNPTIDRGLFSIPYFWMDKDSPIEDSSTLAQSCGGRFFFNLADGLYYYKNAFEHANSPSVATLDETNCERFSMDSKDSDLFESVTVSARPRFITEIKEIWKNNDVVKLLPGEQKQVHAKLNQPLVQYNSTQFTATTTAGLPIQAGQVTIAVAVYSQRLVITITNSSGYTVFLRNFYALGRLLEPSDKIEYSKTSTSPFWSDKVGEEKKISTSVYVQSWSQAKAIGDMIIDRQGVFSDELSVDGYVGNYIVKTGDRVTVNIQGRLTNASYLVFKQSWTLNDNGFSQNLELTSASGLFGLADSEYFITGTHSQNSNKKYFY